MRRYKKLDPKIIRVYDRVKIIDPVVFIRCGYPLGIEEMRKEVNEHFGGVIADLVRSVQKGDKLMLHNSEGKYEDGTNVLIDLEHASPEHNLKGNYKYFDIVNALAYARLQSKNFGGDERTLHTIIDEKIKGKEATVSSIRFVHTGTRVPPSSGYDYWNGGWEYEPGYLSDCKTHKILTVNIHSGNNSIFTAFEPIQIEAIHVEKIPNIQETPVEYEHRMRHTVDKEGII